LDELGPSSHEQPKSTPWQNANASVLWCLDAIGRIARPRQAGPWPPPTGFGPEANQTKAEAVGVVPSPWAGARAGSGRSSTPPWSVPPPQHNTGPVPAESG